MLEAKLKALLITKIKRVRWLENKKLSEHVFQGTLDELKPVLEVEARLHKAPAIFASRDQTKFVIVQIVEGKDCISGDSVRTLSTSLDNKIIDESYCSHD